MAKIQRPGAKLPATGGARGGTPWGRSASGHGAQAAPVVHLLTLAQADTTAQKFSWKVGIERGGAAEEAEICKEEPHIPGKEVLNFCKRAMNVHQKAPRIACTHLVCASAPGCK